MDKWYARPVFFVADMPAALAFYVEALGFAQSWHYEEDGETVATQVNRGDCEVILNRDVDRAGGARLYVALEPDTVAALERDLTARSIAVTRGWWGTPVVRVEDPSGNELLFPLEEA